ncbi:DUF6000 family protein [Streptosporangium lutulentum]
MIGTPESETGRYLDLLHGNFLDLPDWRQADFLQALGRDARQVTDAELECMLAPGEFAAGESGSLPRGSSVSTGGSGSGESSPTCS